MEPNVEPVMNFSDTTMVQSDLVIVPGVYQHAVEFVRYFIWEAFNPAVYHRDKEKGISKLDGVLSFRGVTNVGSDTVLSRGQDLPSLAAQELSVLIQTEFTSSITAVYSPQWS